MTGMQSYKEENQRKDDVKIHEERWPYDYGGRDWSDASTSLGMQRIVCKHQSVQETTYRFQRKYGQLTL